MTAAACLLLLVAPDPWDPAGVCLSDGLRFQVHPHEARYNWRLACDHQNRLRETVEVNNGPEAVARWWDETDWRRAVWDKVDDVKFCQLSVPSKLRSLARLRALLGDEDYFAGRLPLPIPSYRP